jgi:LPS export ABC transporter protein LptC
MGLTIFTIILALFIAEITFLSTKEHKLLPTSKEDINFSTITFEGIKGYHIDKEGISEHIIASQARKFADHDELDDVQLSFEEENLTHHIQAVKANLKDGIFTLQEKVVYTNNQPIELKSEELFYYTKSKILKSPSSFEMTSSQGTMHGDNFVYEMQKKQITGTKMHYTFEVTE